MRRGNSPIPIGHITGLLSRGMSLHATKAERLSGRNNEVHRRLATPASALHKSVEAVLNDRQKRCHK